MIEWFMAATRSVHKRLLQPCWPQLLQPHAPQPPPTAHRASISTSALSDASMVSSNDQLSSQSPRFFLATCSAGAEQNRNQSASRQLQYGGQDGRARQRAAHHGTQIAAHSQQHRRFPPAQHEISMRAVCPTFSTSARSRSTTRSGGCVCAPPSQCCEARGSAAFLVYE